MTRRDVEVPFTVCADIDLAPRPGLALRAYSADVAVRRGAVPDSLPCAQQARGPVWEHGDSLMLIRHPGGVRFLIEGGDTIRYEAAPGVPAGDVGAFLFGSVWAALALQRGLLPLHASAVSRVGAVHAFAGHSGAGKSTLAVALGAHGLASFTDDLLLLDPASFKAKGAEAKCYGSAGLRLYPCGGALTDATLGEPVCAGAHKRWAPPAATRAARRGNTAHPARPVGPGQPALGRQAWLHRAAGRPARGLRPLRRPLPITASPGYRRTPAAVRVAAGSLDAARAGVDVPPPAVGAAIRPGRGVLGRCTHQGARRRGVNALRREGSREEPRAPGGSSAPAGPGTGSGA